MFVFRFLAPFVVLLLILAACEADSTASPSADQQEPSVEVTVGTDEGAELQFDPTEISVTAGATVRLTFVNESIVAHNLVFIAPISAATATIQPGEEETIEFTAPEAGEYTYVCTLHPGMQGTLTVEEA